MQQTPTDHERIVVLEQLFSEQNKKIDKIQETLEVMQTKLFNGYFDKKITDKIKVVLSEFKDDVFDNVEEKIAREVNTQIRAEIGTLALKVLIAGVSSGAFIQFIINWLSKWGDNGMTYSVASFPELDELILVPIGDFHVGSPYFLEKKLDKIINFVENTEQTYLLLLGDLIDNAVPNTISNPFENIMTPQEQLNYLIEKLTPVSKKVLGIVSGNHEERSFKKVGLDIMAVLAGLFDCEYDPHILVLDINIGSEKVGTRRGQKNRINYIVQVAHGSGGGRTHGGKMNAAVRYGQIVLNADIVITGHTHSAKYAEEAGYLVDKRNKAIVKHVKHFVIATSLLGYEDYAQRRGLQPPSHTLSLIRLSGLTKDIQFNLQSL